MFRGVLAGLGFILLAANFLLAQTGSNPPRKPRYSIFERTPRGLARELVTDRPDKTESPITVPAGWFQVELDLVSQTVETAGSIKTTNTATPIFNFKIGVLSDLDLQFVVEPYIRETVRSSLTRSSVTSTGAGALGVRAKLNLWGNDSGSTAFAVMPYLASDPGADSERELGFGIILPLAVDLGRAWGFGTMLQLDFPRDRDDRDAIFIHSATVGHPLIGSLAGYFEIYNEYQAGSPWIATINGGFTLGVTSDLQFDAGINRGVSSVADDVNIFLGLTVRR